MHKQKTSYNLVLCLAGKGSRFTKKGYVTPKYLLKLHDKKSILENILKELYVGPEVELKLILNNENKEWSNEIKQVLENENYNYELQHVGDTRGQAHTASIASEMVENSEPIFFFNGDTIIKGRNLAEISKEIKNNNLSGTIDTFFAKDNHFSYVKVENEEVIEIQEKVVISNMATTGLYGFKSSSCYQRYYNQVRCNKTEEYISDVYKKMLENKEKIKNYFYIDSENTIILGTPEEYEEWLKNGK